MTQRKVATAGVAIMTVGFLVGCGTRNVSSATNAASQTSNSVSKKTKNNLILSSNTSSSDESQNHSAAGKLVSTKPPHMWNDKQGWATVSVFSSNNGSKVFGIKLLTTQNGGTTWSNVGPTLKNLKGLQDEDGSFYSRSFGWFIELAPDHEFIVQRTTDGGASWKSSTSIPTRLGDGGMQIDRVSKNVGYIVVRSAGMTNPSCELYQTVDGGASWKPLKNLPISGTIDFVSKDNGWLAGTNHTPDSLLKANTGHTGMGYTWLYHTTNGGRSWKHIELPIPKSLTSEYTDVGHPIFRGNWGAVTVKFQTNHSHHSAYKLYITNDGGKHWTFYNIPKGPVADVQFISPYLGFLKTISSSPETSEWFRTQNGGKTWTKLNISLRKQGIANTSVRFRTIINWWAVNQARLYKTTNGGKSWVQVP